MWPLSTRSTSSQALHARRPPDRAQDWHLVNVRCAGCPSRVATMPRHLMDRRAATSPSEPNSGQASAMSIEPEEIRAIRKRLGLSQAEAGELLGGGPRAFTKYETGAVKPAAAVVTLLRLLERDPTMIEQLSALKSLPIKPSPASPSPFHIDGEHVAHFNPRLFPELLRRLLHAEADTHGLPTDGIHVSSNITAPDGGEDGRIEWQEGPDRTPSLPCRLTQFQLKAGPVTPSQAGRDVLRNGQVQPMVRKVLDAGGHYRMLCAHPYTRKTIESRMQRIRNSIRDAGIAVKDGQVTFWDADQIAAWANQHPAVAIWAKEQTQPGMVGPFRSWTQWAGDHDNSPWVEDERLPPLQGRVRELAATPQSVLRLVGLSGIGKSRLTLEALGHVGDGSAVSDLVMYADESEANTPEILRVVEALANTGSRAVVVVNRCSPKTHRTLAGTIARTSSRLSLLTLDDEVPATVLDETTVKVEKAPPAIVKAIIDQTLPNLPSDDGRRLAHFSEGFPRIATDVAKAWQSSKPIAHAEDDDIVDAFVLGREPGDSAPVVRTSATLVAAFGVVAVEPEGGDLATVASFRHDLSPKALHIGIGRLVERGVIQRKGRKRVLQPRPIAMRLAERQWQEWSKTQWDLLLASDGNPHLEGLRKTAARVLARLNTTGTALSVVRHLCRPGGPPIPWDVLPALAEVAPAVVLPRLEDALKKTANLSALVEDPRRHVVSALERIVFHANTFSQAARLLLRLAAAETEMYANNATGVFIGLFQIRLGNTAADDNARLNFLADTIDAADNTEREIVVEALAHSLTPLAWRMVGAEIQGTKPALSSWFPPTRDTERAYVIRCLSFLASIAAKEDSSWPTDEARSALGQRLRSWVGPDYMDSLENAVRKVSSTIGVWPEAVESLSHVLKYDAGSHGPEIIRRTEALLRYLRPKNLQDSVHFLVTAMPWDYPAEKDMDVGERGRVQEAALRRLAQDLAQEPQILEAALPQLSRGEQRRAFLFGNVLGELSDQFKPYVWRRRITQAILDAPVMERNFDLLSGYLVGVSQKYPRLALPLKRRLTRSSTLAPVFPRISGCLGVKTPDIKLAMEVLTNGLLPPALLAYWSFGGGLTQLRPSEVTPLFEALLALRGDEALRVTLRLVHAYCYANLDELDGLRPQIRKCVSRFARAGHWPAETMASYHLEQLAEAVLAKGREDADARAVALDLASIMMGSSRIVAVDFPSSVTGKLLSDFPEVVWPLIGAAIVADRETAWGMATTLGMPFRQDHEPPILSLPVETLLSWCRAHPETAPAFAVRVLPVLANQGDELTLHPTTSRLIDEFGDRRDVLAGIGSNIGTFTWVGSTTTYYQQYLGPLGALADHRIAAVRRWAAERARQLEADIERARDYEAELDAEWAI